MTMSRRSHGLPQSATSRVEWLLKAGVVGLALLAPTQWGPTVGGLRVAAADPLLVACTALALLLWMLGGKPRCHAPSPFAIAFLAFAAVSVTAATNRPEALKNTAQWSFYFGAGWVLWRHALGDDATGRAVLRVSAATGVAILALSWTQFADGSVQDLAVRGSFGNRNVLSGYLALAAPFAAAVGLMARGRIRLAGLLLGLAGLLVCLSGAGALALLLAFLSMSALRGRPALVLSCAAVLAVLVLVHPRLPRRGDFADPWVDSIALHDADGELSRRYPEWEAAWWMMVEHPWRGVGAGNYQERIRDYRRIATRPGEPEPDTQNLYLVLGASIGLPGLLAFVGMLLEGLVRAAGAAVRGANSERMLALGSFGALLAFMLAALWHPLLVRGIGLPLAGVLALAQHLHERRVHKPAPTRSS